MTIPLVFPSPELWAEEENPEMYREECGKGVTIYCIASGMAEEKAGNLEEALGFYRSACENHSTHGHLGSCTPLLSLGRQMGRLDQVTGKLESLCGSGDDTVCFYLAKEYFKIMEYHRGFVHLERLCREDFQPPDPADYGPCYHLGNNLQKIREPERASKIFQFDCERNPVTARPSCDRYASLALAMQDVGEARDSIRKFEAIEWVLFLLVSMPFLGYGFLRLGRRSVFHILRWPAPVMALISWFFWESWGFQEPQPHADLFFILPSLLLLSVFALQAHRRLKDRDEKKYLKAER